MSKKSEFMKILGFVMVLCVLVLGCVRVSGSAGFWHKGKDDTQIKEKKLGFDTNDLIPGQTPGSIEISE